MGTLDALRTWRDRNPETDGQDWRVAQGQGWRQDRPVSPAPVEVPTTSRNRMDNTDAARRVGNIAPDRFIATRPKGDRLVYILLDKLSKMDGEAATAGRAWYDANRENLTTDQGSAWIHRIRAKLAEAEARPVSPAPVVNPTKSNAWATWRELAAQLVEFGGPTGARFAVSTEDGSANDLAFWWIVPGREQHTGKFWLRQVIGGQGDVRVRMSPEAMVAIARKIIAAGPKEAMITYGREIGACGHCGRTLTNQASREAGIGPVCARGKGW